MPMLVQICIVVVTLAFVAVVVATMVALRRIGESAARLTSAAQFSMGKLDRVVLEAQEVLASAREMLQPAQKVVQRFQRLGDRAADLSTAVVDEIQTPVLRALAVARGVKAGTSHLMALLNRRGSQTRSPKNGDQDHE